MAISTYTTTFTRAHTATFVADNMRNVLRDIIRENGLDPTRLMDLWDGPTGDAARIWLEGGYLKKITIEFYRPGSLRAATRWDFPIRYDGSGVDDDMWVDWQHLRRTLAKAAPPPSDCVYCVILRLWPGAPDVPGMGDAKLRSTEGLVSRETGTVIATPDIMISIRYWRAG